MFANVKKLIIPEGEVKKIEANGVVLWQEAPSLKNCVRYSTESDGITIYNGGKGYKNNIRIRSGGGEASTIGCATGFIPVNGGDEVWIKCVNFKDGTTQSAINVSDASRTNLGQIVGNNASTGYGIIQENAELRNNYNYASIINVHDDVYKWIVPPEKWGINHIRVSAPIMDGSALVVTINEEI